MISLKNVSKFYYSKGVVASGFSKINLDFKIGEFVAITGESGSGKSTLLNVISGLDTYEEGEMYINGEETSHFSEKDFEDYRRKYIGNIFQNFNLVNSYTVYQNIELVLLLNGNKKKDIKKKVLELIKTVNLYKFKNTKVSKLSGGQKQRVAIARALAKDTPIIIADEPTGNLDSKSALEVINILSQIAKNKLVIIVTHNYDQVEQYVTRKIKMHDGKVLEDKVIKQVDDIEIKEVVNYKDITTLNKLRLGIRNTFNIMPKFLLVFSVFLFITVALISEYSSFKEQEYIESKSGYNNFFQNTSDKRIVIKKNDLTYFTDEDYNKISNLNNIDNIIKNDVLVDNVTSITDNNEFWMSGNSRDISTFSSKLDLGRMPENDSEIILEGSKNDYYLGQQGEKLLEKELYLQNSYSGEIDTNTKLKIVGIKYTDENYTGNFNSKVYVSSAILNKITFQVNQQYSTMKILFMNQYHASDSYNTQYKIVPNGNVPDGATYVTSDLNYLCKNENCINQALNIELSNLYYKETKTLTVTKSYNKNNLNSLLGISDYDANNGSVFVSINDYNSLFNKGNYQSSIFVKDIKKIDTTIQELNDLGYKTLAIKDTLVNSGIVETLRIFKIVITMVLVITLFFISYFVLRIIMKSRNTYFSTIRMLGATKKTAKNLLIIELLTVSNLAYFITLGFIYLGKIKVFSLKFVDTIYNYLHVSDYIILYAVLILMSYLISQKFSKKLFKSSAVSAIKEGE